MFLRVYDKNSQKYYKSICYAKIDIGSFEKAIVINSHKNCVELVSYFDVDKPDYSHPLYEHISSTDTEKWQYANIDTLDKLNKYLKANKLYDRKLTDIVGYQDICNDVNLLIKLFENISVPLTETKFEIRTNDDVSEWNYIRTQKDADDFLDFFAGFHDATIKSMHYEEAYNLRKVNIIFDNSEWAGIAELCFEGVIALHLNPPPENFLNDMFTALIKVENELVLWAGDTDELDEGDTVENFDYDLNYIKALNLKWRKIEE